MACMAYYERVKMEINTRDSRAKSYDLYGGALAKRMCKVIAMSSRHCHHSEESSLRLCEVRDSILRNQMFLAPTARSSLPSTLQCTQHPPLWQRRHNHKLQDRQPQIPPCSPSSSCPSTQMM